MASNGYKQAFDVLLKSYLSLGDNAVTIVRELKKTRNAAIRCKLVGELRSLDFRRLALLDEMDNLARASPPAKS